MFPGAAAAVGLGTMLRTSGVGSGAGWGLCGEFQLPVLLMVGTLPCSVKPQVSPVPTSLPSSCVCYVYVYVQEGKMIITTPILQKGKLRLWQGT